MPKHYDSVETDGPDDGAGMTDERVALTEERNAMNDEPFVVRHYSEDERPTIKGNGFDGLEVGSDREEAERFVAWINARLALTLPAPPPRQQTGRPRSGIERALTEQDAREIRTGRAGPESQYAAQPTGSAPVEPEPNTPASPLKDRRERQCWSAGWQEGYAAGRATKEGVTPSPASEALTPSEAIYAFAGWLTTRPGSIVAGETHDAAAWADAVEQFRVSQGWPEPRQHYGDRIKPYSHVRAALAATKQDPAAP